MVSMHVAILALILGVDSGGQTVLLDFYSDSCPPCHRMMPVVARLSEMGYPINKINVNRNRHLVDRFGIDIYPTFVMVVNGREFDRVVGATSFERLESMSRRGLALDAQLHQPQPPKPAPVMQIPVAGIPSTPVTPATAITPVTPSTGAKAVRNRSDASMIASTVLLRIEDSTGHSFGTGTIIHTREGEALILTCGHIFRDSQGRGRIEVYLFDSSSEEGLPGKLLSYNLKRDIGLVSIRISTPVTVSRVASIDAAPKQGDPVVSVGCTHGEQPTARHSYITSINKYLGPPNLQVAGQPVQGRSGGGLFSSDGQVIGVCNAADPQDNEGFYSALDSIHAELDRMKFSFAYQSETSATLDERPMVAVSEPFTPRPFQTPATALVSQASHSEEVSHHVPVDVSSAKSSRTEASLSAEELALLERIRRAHNTGDEVILIVRSASDPKSSSEVIVLDRGSF